MSFFSSSSLTASDSFNHDLPRLKRNGLLKTGEGRHSKQHMAEKKMFGSRFGKHGKDFSIGKKFKMKGLKDLGSIKGMGKVSAHSISPNIEEFEHMLHSSVTHNPNRRESPFRRKSFS